MKAALPTLLGLSLIASAFAAGGTPVAPITPQPRVRLVQTSAATTAKAVEPSLPASHPIVVMSNMWCATRR